MLKNGFLRILLVSGVSTLIYLGGCVDTSVNPIPSSFDFKSQVNIVNVAEGVAQAEVTLKSKDGKTTNFGNVAFGAEAPAGAFMEISSGTKTLSFSHDGTTETFQFSADTDRKMRIFVFGPTGERDIYRHIERYTFQTKDDKHLFPKDSSQVVFFNGSSDAEVTEFGAVSDGIDTLISLTKTLKMGNAAGYFQLKSGSYTFYVISGSDTLTSFTANLESQRRYTAVIYDTLANLKTKVFTDD